MIAITYKERFDFEYDIQGLLRSFFPGVETVTVREQEESVRLDVEWELNLIVTFFDYDSPQEMSLVIEETGDRETFRAARTEDMKGCAFDISDGIRKETKNRMKRALYQLLQRHTGRSLAWGTLSGIRPTKITTEYLEEGASDEEVLTRFQTEYLCSKEKAKECLNISKREQMLLKNIDYRNGYSLYVGIPFCPSTCLYCSFTSYPVSRFRNKMDDYVDALIRELEYVAGAFAHKKLDSIYVGGGTPTSLEPHMLHRLLSKICELFPAEHVKEFTVEAGRPDSITEEKLRAIKSYPVTRISINPQTMHQKTLKLIGRQHTVEQFLNAYQMAREIGFDNINMDFILGLPDETKEDVRESMEWVRKLKPESLTIHSLAIKRASRLNIQWEEYQNYRMKNSEDIMDITKDCAASLGMNPYYLYRQKNMAGNLENIGYSIPGKEGVYNILIMEEKQTIVAVGAGASTKYVHEDGRTIHRIENVKDVDLYIGDVEKMIERKRAYFG